MKDERMHNYLVHHHITWQFNLRRATWWGDQFERMVGLLKQALYKSIGGANRIWSELEGTILDAEVAINNRRPTYLEEDVQLPVLTPNTTMLAQPNLLPEEDRVAVENNDLRKRAKYLRCC